MTREVRIFEVSVEDQPEDIPFMLRFRRADGEQEDFTFRAIGDPGAGAVRKIAKMVRYDRHGNQQYDLNAIDDFFERVLVDGDYERLSELLERRDLTVPNDTLLEMFTALVEEYSGRPTVPSPSSSNGRRPTGKRSTDSASLKASTSSA